MSCLIKYKLCELYELSSGISTKTEQFGHGYPFCSFSTIFNNPILPDIFPDLMDTTIKDREIYSIKEGDVLLTRTSETLDELAMTSVALKDYPDSTFSGFAKRLRPISHKAYPKFMAFFFRSQYFRKIINNKAVMTLRASFNENIFNDISFDLPPLEQQIKAGDFLFDIEKKINNNILIANDYKRLSELIFDHWFMEYEYPFDNKEYKSNNGKLVWNEKVKQRIPMNWQVLKMKDLIDHEIGGDWGENISKNNFTKNVVCIRGTDINNILNGKNSTLETRYILEKNNKKCLKDGNYVVEVSGTPGRSIYINDSLLKRFDCSVIASNFCYAFSFKDSEYMYWFDFIWRKLFDSGVTQYFSGKTTIANLLFESLSNSIYLAVPPKDIIKAFNSLVKPMYENIQSLYHENDSLNNMRNYLINFFITGQVKFNKDENENKENEIKQAVILNYLERFNQWKQKQGYAARGDVDDETLKKIFDAMDEDDKK